jgi:hypothetical protein
VGQVEFERLFHADYTATYDELAARFAWKVPARYNIGVDVCDRHAAARPDALALIFEDETGAPVIVEASTSWAYVGAGLRIDLALMGPEYAMEFSSLNTGLKVFLSRAIGGGEVTRDEFLAARAAGKPTRFIAADMHHGAAIDKARRQGQPPPVEFGGALAAAL